MTLQEQLLKELNSINLKFQLIVVQDNNSELTFGFSREHLKWFITHYYDSDLKREGVQIVGWYWEKNDYLYEHSEYEKQIEEDYKKEKISSDPLIVIGSQAFFKDYPDYIFTDIDYLRLVEKNTNFIYMRHTSFKEKCIIEIVKHTPEEYVEIMQGRTDGFEIVQFLVPEFVHKVGFTIEHLKQIKSLRDKLGFRHQYAGVIYDYYIENNDFVLTEEQRDEAYRVYQKGRPELYEEKNANT